MPHNATRTKARAVRFVAVYLILAGPIVLNFIVNPGTYSLNFVPAYVVTFPTSCVVFWLAHSIGVGDALDSHAVEALSAHGPMLAITMRSIADEVGCSLGLPTATSRPRSSGSGPFSTEQLPT